MAPFGPGLFGSIFQPAPCSASSRPYVPASSQVAPPTHPASEGILLGEAYAVTYLQDLLQTVALKFLHNSFLLSKFDGSLVRITAHGVYNVTD